MMDSSLGADLEDTAVGDKLALMILAPLAKPAGLDLSAALPWLRGQHQACGFVALESTTAQTHGHRK